MNVIRKRCGGDEGVKRFIDAVKLHPTIWVHSDGDMNVGSVDCLNSFEEVINRLGWHHKVSVESARLAWKQLRMQYNKERRNRSTDKISDSNESDSNSSKWEFYERMSFVDRVVRENGSEEMNNQKNGTEIMSHCSSTQGSGIDNDENSDNGSDSDCSTSHVNKSSLKGVGSSRKRKLSSQSSSSSPVDKGSKSGRREDESLNSALEAVAESAVKREMKKLGETDATQPLKLPSFVKSDDIDTNSNKNISPASLSSQKSPRIVRLSMKALESLSSAKRGDRGAIGTNYKFIKTATTIPNRTATMNQKCEPSKFIVDGKSGKTKIFKVIKTNSATGNVTSVVKKASSTAPSNSSTLSVISSTSVPKTKTIEETLTNLVANAPSVSEVDGSLLTTTTANNRSSNEALSPLSLSLPPSDSKPILKNDNDSHPICFPSKTAPRQPTKEQSVAVIEQESNKANASIKEEHSACSLPSTSALSHSKSGNDSSDTQPATLMSVLQQCLGTSIDMKEMESMQHSSNDPFAAISSSSPSRTPTTHDVIGPPRITCQKCANELPALRRSLGRLESRVDSMITMVKTLCTRQATIEASRKQMIPSPSSSTAAERIYKTPPIVIRPRAVSATAQVTVKSNQPPSLQSSSSQSSHLGITVTNSNASSPTSTSKVTNLSTTTPLTLNNCQYGRMATLVRVTSGSGSTFKLIRAPPKLVPSSPSSLSYNGRVIKASTSKAVDNINNSDHNKDSSNNNNNNNNNNGKNDNNKNNEEESSLSSSKVSKKVNKAASRNKFAIANSNDIIAEGSDNSSSRPLLKSINVAKSNQQSTRYQINDSTTTTNNINNCKKSAESGRDSSPDCAPPSLSTRFTPAPKQPDRTLTYLHKAVIRSLLLFQGPFFTIGDFRLRGPAVVRTVEDDKLKECLVRLLDDGLLRRIDDHLDLTDPEAAFEKERLKAKLIKLSDYGITKQQYATALEQIIEKAGLFLKR